MTRSIVIKHLTLKLTTRFPGVKVLQFESIDSKDFKSYLDNAGLHFAMLHDGASASKSQAVEDPSISDKECLRAIIACFIQQNLNIALINRIEIRDTKVSLISFIQVLADEFFLTGFYHDHFWGVHQEDAKCKITSP